MEALEALFEAVLDFLFVVGAALALVAAVTTDFGTIKAHTDSIGRLSLAFVAATLYSYSLAFTARYRGKK